MSHLQEIALADIDDYVIAGLIATVGRSNVLIWSAAQDEGHGAVGRRTGLP
jgi:hypothetical protein